MALTVWHLNIPCENFRHLQALWISAEKKPSCPKCNKKQIIYRASIGKVELLDPLLLRAYSSQIYLCFADDCQRSLQCSVQAAQQCVDQCCRCQHPSSTSENIWQPRAGVVYIWHPLSSVPLFHICEKTRTEFRSRSRGRPGWVPGPAGAPVWPLFGWIAAPVARCCPTINNAGTALAPLFSEVRERDGDEEVREGGNCEWGEEHCFCVVSVLRVTMRKYKQTEREREKKKTKMQRQTRNSGKKMEVRRDRKRKKDVQINVTVAYLSCFYFLYGCLLPPLVSV